MLQQLQKFKKKFSLYFFSFYHVTYIVNPVLHNYLFRHQMEYNEIYIYKHFLVHTVTHSFISSNKGRIIQCIKVDAHCEERIDCWNMKRGQKGIFLRDGQFTSKKKLQEPNCLCWLMVVEFTHGVKLTWSVSVVVPENGGART